MKKSKNYWKYKGNHGNLVEIDDFSMTNTSPIYEVAPTYYPDPIVITETEFVNQTDNFQENLDEEIRINSSKSGCSGSITTSCAIVSLISLTGIGLLVLKKGRKHEK